MSKKILSGDILIADIILELKDNPELSKFVREHGFEPGEKYTITREQFKEEFSPAVEGMPLSVAAGGSAANTLWTMGKLLDDKIDTTFIGIIGDSMYSNMISKSLEGAGITIIPDHKDVSGESAVSFVFKFPDGQRTIATYPGDAKEIVKPEIISEDLIKNSDIIFAQGSLWHKFDSEVPDKILSHRWDNEKELWLSMPTNAWFAEQERERFKFLLPSANVVLSNDQELARIYNQTPEEALVSLEKDFSEFSKNNRITSQVGFITKGEDGADVVTKDGIHHVEARAVYPADIVNTLGAGDTSFAGFLTGHVSGFSPVISAEVAMAMGAENVKVDSARLPDPKAALRSAMPYLADKILGSPDKQDIYEQVLNRF